MTEQTITAETLDVNPEVKIEEQDLSRYDRAQKIVQKNMYWAMGFGVIPIPFVDLLAIGGFQAKAIKELSDLYEIPFNKYLFTNVMASLISGLGAPICGGILAFSFVHVIPILGPLSTVALTPLMAGAFTYALGRIFILHFESGGTFLTLNPAAVRDHFKQEFEKGKCLAGDLLKQKSASEAAVKPVAETVAEVHVDVTPESTLKKK